MQHKLRSAGRRALVWIALSGWLALGAHAPGALAQAVSTTTVQGTVYLASGQPGAGTLVIKWPAFTTSAGQAITAGSSLVKIPQDGFVSVQLAPNQGATPAGEYYTAVYYLSDGSTSTEYWVVPAGAQATLAQVRAQVMPAAQAVQAASKAYVDQTVSELTQSLLTASGGNLSGPLYLNGDPSQPLQAATKRYVDSSFAQAVPLRGGTMTGPLTATRLGGLWQVDQFAGADFGAKLQACVNALDPTYGGTCDARNFTGSQSMSANLTMATGNSTVLLPCATIATASQIVVPAGVRNVALRGCALRGGSQASGSTGGTVFAYSGSTAMLQVGDPSYTIDTPGFHLDNAVINTTAATSATAQALAAYRAQELDLENLYLLGNADQTAMTLDGTGNYTGGTFLDDQISGFQTAVNAIGHQAANPATTDWLNASTFVRLHINCPTANGSPIAGTTGIDLQQGDGNTFTGGDVEGCATALHLGPNAQNNTLVGMRNENSSQQVVADAGSAYNNWITGGTLFTGQLTDNGTRNSFLDTFHRSFNALNGDWYGSQQDLTLTNHFRLGIGSGNERGLLNRYQTDSGYRWTTGLSDAASGEQFYQVLDELNNVYRLSIGQYNNGQSSTNNQTVINSAGTGAVVLNGSNGSGTGGVIIGSGGAAETTVATVDKSGNAQFNGTLQVGGASQSTGTMTVRNNADAEVDYYLWPGLSASQKGSFTYKDWNGASQWYLLKDQNNNWALNSAVGGLDSFKAYQSTNSGDTYVNASNPSGVVRVNYETGSGGGFKVYGGNSSTLYASFTGSNSIAFPGLAASSGRNCLQIDASGYITNTGAACGTGSGTGTVNASNSGYIAYYTGNGSAIGGLSSVPLTSGGTGATTAAQALANLGALSVAGGTVNGAVNSSYTGTNTFAGSLAVGTTPPTGAPTGVLSASSTYFPTLDWDATAFGVRCDGTTDDTAKAQAAINAAEAAGATLLFPPNKTCLFTNYLTTSGIVRLKGSNTTLKWAPSSLIQYAISGSSITTSEISGFNFTGSSNVVGGIVMAGGTIQNVKIHDNTISGFTGCPASPNTWLSTPIQVNGSHVTIRNNAITGNGCSLFWQTNGPSGAGIYHSPQPDSDWNLADNRIDGTNLIDGMLLFNLSESTIHDNDIRNIVLGGPNGPGDSNSSGYGIAIYGTAPCGGTTLASPSGLSRTNNVVTINFSGTCSPPLVAGDHINVYVSTSVGGTGFDGSYTVVTGGTTSVIATRDSGISLADDTGGGASVSYDPHLNTVHDNRIVNTAGMGVYLQTASEASVSSNVFSKVCQSIDDTSLPCGFVSLLNARRVTVTGNSGNNSVKEGFITAGAGGSNALTGNVASKVRYGIRLRGTDTLDTVSSNAVNGATIGISNDGGASTSVIANNSVTAASYGAIVQSNSAALRNLYMGNAVDERQLTAGLGLQVTLGTQGLFLGNLVTGNRGYAYDIRTANNLVGLNLAGNSSGSGFSSGSATYSLFFRNYYLNASGYGINNGSASTNVLADNYISTSSPSPLVPGPSFSYGNIWKGGISGASNLFTCTLASGTCTISTSEVQSTDDGRIWCTRGLQGANPGVPSVSAISAGVSFTVTSSNASDTGNVACRIVH